MDLILNEQADDSPFVDPNVEGAFTTSESRDKVHEYIQKHIEAYESRICYYKTRHNALTVTCRIPTEILASIFSHVVLDNVEDYADARSVRHYCTKTFSHICSHWREVALSTPTLWSTINLGDTLTWTLEMLQHSKTAPLSVIHAGEVSKKAYPALIQILNSHSPRIKNLLLDYQPSLWSDEYDESEVISTDENRAILELLGQHDFFNMERLAIKTPSETYLYEDAALPDEIITQLTSLKHLALRGYGINWEGFSAFKGLKSLTITRIPHNFRPSMVHLLRFISWVPLLETLVVADIDSRQPILPSNIEHVRMEHLDHLDLSCNSISIINSFFGSLIFPNNNMNMSTAIISSEIPPEPSQTDIAAMQELARRLDGIIQGPVLDLIMDPCRIQCRRQGATIAEFNLSPALNPGTVKAVLRSLRLDQVVYLELDLATEYEYDFNLFCDNHVWSLLGSLPQVRKLELHRGHTDIVTKALRRIVQSLSKTGAQATRNVAFPALTVLIIKDFFFDYEARNFNTRNLFKTIMFRTAQNLPLKKLMVLNSYGLEYNEDVIDKLTGIVDEIVWERDELRMRGMRGMRGRR
ncbi:hypothetical protein H0H92_001055 [Tricholoma furcatifolium]|nr:hypothetical protein H0H92_001055 [Tricholoma furcatifolium]